MSHPLSDQEAFAAVYRRHWTGVVRSAQAVLHDVPQAEDVACDVFAALWRHRERFDPARGDIGTYLHLVARSRAIDAARAGATHRRIEEKLAALAPQGTEDDPAVEVERRDERSRLLAAVGTLPVAQRTAIALTFWGGLTCGELAVRTQAKLPTAKSRTRLALGRLHSELAGSALRPVPDAA